MAKKSDTLNRDQEQDQIDQRLKREDVLKALRRLRDIGETLPVVDAAAIIREGRDLSRQDSR